MWHKSVCVCAWSFFYGSFVRVRYAMISYRTPTPSTLVPLSRRVPTAVTIGVDGHELVRDKVECNMKTSFEAGNGVSVISLGILLIQAFVSLAESNGLGIDVFRTCEMHRTYSWKSFA